MESLIGKGRKIFDLNNVPLVSGRSTIKWHLVHSIHAEHRGRTSKCPIVSHHVDYGFSKHVQNIRIGVDKSNNLTDCPIEFEVVQEFASGDKLTLGVVKLNLSEYVTESEPLAASNLSNGNSASRRAGGTGDDSPDVSPTNHKRKVSLAGTGGGSGGGSTFEAPEGIVRRYLLQDSKINSTLKLSILMVQVDGDRNFAAPPLKTATAFSGIAGIVPHEPSELQQQQQQAKDELRSAPTFKSQDTADIHDLYRRVLSASWCRLPTELPADECVEDIFAGGNGWRTMRDYPSSGSDSDSSDGADNEAGTSQGHGHGHGHHHTLRPSDLRHLHHRHRTTHKGNSNNTATGGGSAAHKRAGSSNSAKSVATLTGRGGRKSGTNNAGTTSSQQHQHHPQHLRVPMLDDERDHPPAHLGLSRSTSMMSFSQSDDISIGSASTKEVGEGELRNDLVAWKLPA